MEAALKTPARKFAFRLAGCVRLSVEWQYAKPSAHEDSPPADQSEDALMIAPPHSRGSDGSPVRVR